MRAAKFRVYNPGDVETPFKLRLKLNKSLSVANDKPFYISLQRNEGIPGYASYKNCNNIEDIQEGIRYHWRKWNKKKSSYEEIFSNLYLYNKKFRQYKGNDQYSITFINSSNGKIYSLKRNDKKYELEKYSNDIWINIPKWPTDENKKDGSGIFSTYKTEEDLNNVKFMSFRCKESDGTDSLKGIIETYKTRGNYEVFLEIDSGRESINLIQTNGITTETIPAQFLLHRGDFFKIPPKLDNLYIFIYTKNVTGENETGTPPNLFYMDGSTIEYDYLYY